MQIVFSVMNDVALVTVSGRLDALTAAEFDRQVAGFLQDGTAKMVLSCGDLEYISSAGLRSMLALAKQLKARGGRLVCAGLKGTAREVYDMSGFAAAISLFETEEEARAAFS